VRDTRGRGSKISGSVRVVSSPVVGVLAAVLCAAAAACSGATVQAGPCGKDSDCKGARVCVAGSCVERGGSPDPRTAGAAGGDAGVAIDAKVVTGPRPFAMLGGGGRHLGRAAGPAPRKVPKEVWKVTLGAPITGAPTLAPDGTILVAAHDGKLTAITPTGVVKWTFAMGDRSWSTPAVAVDGTVYVGSDDDHLYAIDGANGTLKWKLRLGQCDPKGFGPESSRCDADGGPMIGDDGTIYLGGDGIHAVWADGTLRWRFATAEHVASAPALAPDGTIYAGSQDDALYALAPDGTKRWEVRTGGDLDAPPVIGDDGTVYIGGDDDALYAVRSDGSIAWKTLLGGDVRGAAALATDGTIYVGSYDRNLYAIAPDGQVRWRVAAADKLHAGPLVASNDLVLFGAQDDHLYAVGPDGVLLWVYDVGGDLDATPTIASDGTLYLAGDDGVLRALR
jgi:outer membrane protein assembly factor BamB